MRASSTAGAAQRSPAHPIAASARTGAASRVGTVTVRSLCTRIPPTGQPGPREKTGPRRDGGVQGAARDGERSVPVLLHPRFQGAPALPERLLEPALGELHDLRPAERVGQVLLGDV